MNEKLTQLKEWFLITLIWWCVGLIPAILIADRARLPVVEFLDVRGPLWFALFGGAVSLGIRMFLDSTAANKLLFASSLVLAVVAVSPEELKAIAGGAVLGIFLLFLIVKSFLGGEKQVEPEQQQAPAQPQARSGIHFQASVEDPQGAMTVLTAEEQRLQRIRLARELEDHPDPEIANKARQDLRRLMGIEPESQEAGRVEQQLSFPPVYLGQAEHLLRRR